VRRDDDLWEKVEGVVRATGIGGIAGAHQGSEGILKVVGDKGMREASLDELKLNDLKRDGERLGSCRCGG
jgi:hypothetical protein